MNIESDVPQQIPSNLDLFSAKPINVGFQQTSVVEYNPVNASGTWPSRFIINSGSSYLNLAHCYLQTGFSLFKKQVTKDKDGKESTELVPVTENDKVSFINGYGATAIKNLKVVFNNRQVYNSNDMYAYNAYFRRRLGIETSRNAEDLQLGGYFEDSESSQVSGAGYNQRRKFFQSSGQFFTIAQLDADIFRQNKLLINHMTVEIEITPHNKDFFLIAQDKTTYVANITSHKLYIKQHQLIPSLDTQINNLLLGLNERGEKELVKYPYMRSLVNNFYIGAGRNDYNATLFNDYVPKRIFVAFVDANAFKGTTNTSPFNFDPKLIDRIHVSVNNKIVPTYLGGTAKKINFRFGI